MPDGPKDTIWPLMVGLAVCLENRLAEYDVPVCRAIVHPGATPPWDTCGVESDGAEGQAWVAVPRVAPTTAERVQFPAEATGAYACFPAEHVVTMTVGVLRCAATVDDQGRPPSVSQVMADAAKVSRDRAIIDEAIRCCFLDSFDPRQVSLRHWEPLGPQGGCVGGQRTLLVAAASCACPE